MKKFLLIVAALSYVCGATATYTDGYYDRMEGKKKEALKAAVKECVKSHKRLVYIDLPNYWQFSDVYPELINGEKRWWEMYSNNVYMIRTNQNPKSSFSANKMQREHSVPKSWWKWNGDVEYTDAYTDLWNLYPSDGTANQAKSNYPLGVVDVASFDNGCTKVGVPASGTGGGAGNVFEPADEYKGDFARSFFYMATVYDDIHWVSYYPWMFAEQAYPTLKTWAYNMLLDWSRRDPVSQKELIRNDAVEQSQGNRNPFIDFPDLAEYIWGTRMQETFRISEQDGTQTPPIDGDPVLTLPVNDETLDFGQVAVGGTGSSWLVLKGKNFTSALSVRIGGADKDMFVLSTRSIPASAINMTGEYMLAIQYKPTEKAVHNASLSIYDGGLASSIRVNLRGEGCDVPRLSRLTATAATDVAPYAYTANWGAAPEVVDYYVVRRTRYLPDGSETEELDASSNSLRIEGRDPAVMESYSVCSSRLGYLSEASNSITVETSGLTSLYDDSVYAVAAPCDGGFRILSNSPVDCVRVFDTTGLLVRECRDVRHGDFIALPKGLYIVVSGSLRSPARLLVR